MRHEPIDMNLERAGTATREMPDRRRPFRMMETRQLRALPAAPEAFDEVFASLSQQPTEHHAGDRSATLAKPSLNAVPLVALSASLERQHERLAALVRELETGFCG
jgi:hypothetical protein